MKKRKDGHHILSKGTGTRGRELYRPENVISERLRTSFSRVTQN